MTDPTPGSGSAHAREPDAQQPSEAAAPAPPPRRVLEHVRSLEPAKLGRSGLQLALDTLGLNLPVLAATHPNLPVSAAVVARELAQLERYLEQKIRRVELQRGLRLVARQLEGYGDPELEALSAYAHDLALEPGLDAFALAVECLGVAWCEGCGLGTPATRKDREGVDLCSACFDTLTPIPAPPRAQASQAGPRPTSDESAGARLEDL